MAGQVDLPPGWNVTWGGQFENLRAASRRLVFIVPLVLLMIFVLLTLLVLPAVYAGRRG